MKIKFIFTVALVVLAAVAVLWLRAPTQQPIYKTPVPVTDLPTQHNPPNFSTPVPTTATPVPENSQRTSDIAPTDNNSQTSDTRRASNPLVKPPLVDPVARIALAYVGLDPDAEDYWLEAINDPGLPPKERQDLIEDLNEVGISDPKNPGPDDLPVILTRMQLLEQMPAMDQVNADAMKEAYKDLANLAQLASGTGGEPVK